MVQKEDLEQLFVYDNGRLIWKFRKDVPTAWNTKFAGTFAGSVRKDGYIAVQFKLHGKRYVKKLHQLIWVLHHGVWPVNGLDHEDRNISNNRIENLRDIPHRQNCFNRGANKNSKSRIKGVSWHKKNSCWVASIFRDVKIHLGSFASLQEALEARRVAEGIYHNDT